MNSRSGQVTFEPLCIRWTGGFRDAEHISERDGNSFARTRDSKKNAQRVKRKRERKLKRTKNQSDTFQNGKVLGV